MNEINWGVVFGVCSLLLLQASFAVGACLLFFAVKAQVQRTNDTYNNHLRETDALKRLSESLGKKIERYEQKIEELKAVKIDGWEEACTDLAKKIKTVNARVSAMYSKIAREEEEEIPPPENFYQNAGPAPTQNTNNGMPAGGFSPDFGRTI